MTSATSILSGLAKVNKATFRLSGLAMSAQDLFAPDCLLPVVVAHAQAKAAELLGADLQCRLHPEPNALLDMRAEIPEIMPGKLSDLVRALFLTHATERVFGISRGGEIDCTPVLAFYQRPLSERFEVPLHEMDSKWPLAQRAPTR